MEFVRERDPLAVAAMQRFRELIKREKANLQGFQRMWPDFTILKPAVEKK